MSASFIASFFAYLITAIYVLVSTPMRFTSDTTIQWIVVAVLLLVAIYYYYTVAYVEMDPNVHVELEKAHFAEWYIRVFALLVLFLLWVVLELKGWTWFVGVLVGQHFVYLLWDLIVRKHFNVKKFFWIDLFALLASIALFFVSAPGSPLLHADDIKDPKSLIIALKSSQPHPDLCDYIKKWYLSDETKGLLDKYDNSMSPSGELVDSLVKDLNRVLIEEPHLYDKHRFQNILLCDKCQRNIGRNLWGDDLISHNRTLLMDAFPRVIAEDASYSSPIRTHFLLGVITLAYAVIIGIGIFLVIKFNPFAYITRSQVR